MRKPFNFNETAKKIVGFGQQPSRERMALNNIYENARYAPPSRISGFNSGRYYNALGMAQRFQNTQRGLDNYRAPQGSSDFQYAMNTVAPQMNREKLALEQRYKQLLGLNTNRQTLGQGLVNNFVKKPINQIGGAFKLGVPLATKLIGNQINKTLTQPVKDAEAVGNFVKENIAPTVKKFDTIYNTLDTATGGRLGYNRTKEDLANTMEYGIARPINAFTSTTRALTDDYGDGGLSEFKKAYSTLTAPFLGYARAPGYENVDFGETQKNVGWEQLPADAPRNWYSPFVDAIRGREGQLDVYDTIKFLGNNPDILIPGAAFTKPGQLAAKGFVRGIEGVEALGRASVPYGQALYDTVTRNSGTTLSSGGVPSFRGFGANLERRLAQQADTGGVGGGFDPGLQQQLDRLGTRTTRPGFGGDQVKLLQDVDNYKKIISKLESERDLIPETDLANLPKRLEIETKIANNKRYLQQAEKDLAGLSVKIPEALSETPIELTDDMLPQALIKQGKTIQGMLDEFEQAVVSKKIQPINGRYYTQSDIENYFGTREIKEPEINKKYKADVSLSKEILNLLKTDSNFKNIMLNRVEKDPLEVLKNRFGKDYTDKTIERVYDKYQKYFEQGSGNEINRETARAMFARLSQKGTFGINSAQVRQTYKPAKPASVQRRMAGDKTQRELYGERKPAPQQPQQVVKKTPTKLQQQQIDEGVNFVLKELEKPDSEVAKIVQSGSVESLNLRITNVLTGNNKIEIARQVVEKLKEQGVFTPVTTSKPTTQPPPSTPAVEKTKFGKLVDKVRIKKARKDAQNQLDMERVREEQRKLAEVNRVRKKQAEQEELDKTERVEQTKRQKAQILEDEINLTSVKFTTESEQKLASTLLESIEKGTRKQEIYDTLKQQLGRNPTDDEFNKVFDIKNPITLENLKSSYLDQEGITEQNLKNIVKALNKKGYIDEAGNILKKPSDVLKNPSDTTKRVPKKEPLGEEYTLVNEGLTEREQELASLITRSIEKEPDRLYNGSEIYKFFRKPITGNRLFDDIEISNVRKALKNRGYIDSVKSGNVIKTPSGRVIEPKRESSALDQADQTPAPKETTSSAIPNAQEAGVQQAGKGKPAGKNKGKGTPKQETPKTQPKPAGKNKDVETALQYEKDSKIGNDLYLKLDRAPTVDELIKAGASEKFAKSNGAKDVETPTPTALADDTPEVETQTGGAGGGEPPTPPRTRKKKEKPTPTALADDTPKVETQTGGAGGGEPPTPPRTRKKKDIDAGETAAQFVRDNGREPTIKDLIKLGVKKTDAENWYRQMKELNTPKPKPQTNSETPNPAFDVTVGVKPEKPPVVPRTQRWSTEKPRLFPNPFNKPPVNSRNVSVPTFYEAPAGTSRSRYVYKTADEEAKAILDYMKKAVNPKNWNAKTALKAAGIAGTGAGLGTLLDIWSDANREAKQINFEEESKKANQTQSFMPGKFNSSFNTPTQKTSVEKDSATNANANANTGNLSSDVKEAENAFGADVYGNNFEQTKYENAVTDLVNQGATPQDVYESAIDAGFTEQEAVKYATAAQNIINRSSGGGGGSGGYGGSSGGGYGGGSGSGSGDGLTTDVSGVGGGSPDSASDPTNYATTDDFNAYNEYNQMVSKMGTDIMTPSESKMIEDTARRTVDEVTKQVDRARRQILGDQNMKQQSLMEDARIAKQALDDKYFQQYMQARQNMANRGLLNSGMTNDAIVRLGMAKTQELGNIEKEYQQSVREYENNAQKAMKQLQDQYGDNMDYNAILAKTKQDYLTQRDKTFDSKLKALDRSIDNDAAQQRINNTLAINVAKLQQNATKEINRAAEAAQRIGIQGERLKLEWRRFTQKGKLDYAKLVSLNNWRANSLSNFQDKSILTTLSNQFRQRAIMANGLEKQLAKESSKSKIDSLNARIDQLQREMLVIDQGSAEITGLNIQDAANQIK